MGPGFVVQAKHVKSPFHYWGAHALLFSHQHLDLGHSGEVYHCSTRKQQPRTDLIQGDSCKNSLYFTWIAKMKPTVCISQSTNICNIKPMHEDWLMSMQNKLVFVHEGALLI
jgi:hypothetical protein